MRIVHIYTAFLLICISFLPFNFLLHFANKFNEKPVWIRWCIFNCFLSPKFDEQCSHLNGFAPNFYYIFEIKICLNMYQNGFVHGFLNIVVKKNLKNICHIYRVSLLLVYYFLQDIFFKNLYVLACVVLGFFFLQNLMSIDHIYIF